jgi:membrane protease YdiL (CAAX protease family)
VAIFVALIVLLGSVASAIARAIHPPSRSQEMSPGSGLVGEVMSVALLILATWIVALIERRKLLDYNLRGPRRGFHFATGLVCGFAALSALVGGLTAGGWLHFGPVALSGGQILLYALLWGATFLLVGCFEEGTMRCYLLFTFTRGINFQWAAGLVGCVSGLLLWKVHGEGAWGAYMLAVGGLLPCFVLQMKKAPSSGFWNAAWVTSFLFGAGHTGNNGENWIGIFAAGAIGFVFCVSVYVTGSAWWAIGCHAAWDWGETYFYGTADSGLVAKGHLLTTTPAGPAFWSGGADGPEGSVLVLAVIALLLLAVLAFYGRGRQKELAAGRPAAG